MRHASEAKIVAEVGWQAVIVAQQNASEQRRLRLRNELGNGGLGATFEGKDSPVERTAFIFGQHGDVGQRHEAVDALAGEVSAVAKGFAFGWRFQNARHTQAAAVVDDREAVGLHLHHAVHGQLRAAADLDAVYFDAQIDKTVANVWLIYHQPGDGDIACAIVIGDMLSIDGGYGRSIPNRTQGQHGNTGSRPLYFLLAT